MYIGKYLTLVTPVLLSQIIFLQKVTRFIFYLSRLNKGHRTAMSVKVMSGISFLSFYVSVKSRFNNLEQSTFLHQMKNALL